MKSSNRVKIIGFLLVEFYHPETAEYNRISSIDSDHNKSIIFIRLELLMVHSIWDKIIHTLIKKIQ